MARKIIFNPLSGKFDYIDDADVAAVWGSITGTLSAQTDLQTALNAKADALTADENYVSDAQLVVIGNTSGTNTGDQDLSSLAPKANPTFTGTVILPKTVEIQDTSADHQYVLAVSELTADRTITLPLLTGADTFVFQDHTQTLTNKRITKRVVTAADATSITPNTDNADWTYQANTQGAGTLTINADSGTPTNCQPWGLKIKSTNVQTFSWNAVFAGGTNPLPTATTGSSQIDYFTFIYDTVDSKWHFTGSATNL